MTPQLPETHYLCKSKSASGLIKTGDGFLGGFLVTSSAAGVIRFYDNTAASGTVLIDQLTVYTGDTFDLRIEFRTGLFFNLVSGSATVSILYI